MELKKSILEHLFANKQLSDYQKKLASHGLDILLNDVRNYIIVIILSLFLDNIINAICFIISFSILRVHCGGYHAPTKARCCLTFVCIYLLFLLFITADISKTITFIISMIAMIYIIFNAPVEHIRNKLSEKEIKHNKRLAISISAMLFLSGSVLMRTDFGNYKILFYSLISNSVLMIILKHSGNWRYYNGNQMCNH